MKHLSFIVHTTYKSMDALEEKNKCQYKNWAKLEEALFRLQGSTIHLKILSLYTFLCNYNFVCQERFSFSLN